MTRRLSLNGLPGAGLSSPPHKELGHNQVPNRKTTEETEQQSQLSAVPLRPQLEGVPGCPTPPQGIPSAVPYPSKGRLQEMSSCSLDPRLVPRAWTHFCRKQILILLMRHCKYNQSFLFPKISWQNFP